MQAQVLAFQLELDLWQDLKTAKNEPETVDILQLWQDLEQVIEQSKLDQQLRVAGDAITSIVEVYAIRANAILSTLEVQDTKTEPILSENFLDDLMRQSMTIDLSDMMEECFKLDELDAEIQKSAKRSVVAPVDKKKALAIANSKIDAKRMVTELAGREQVSHWADVIAQEMQKRSGSEAVSLLQLQQALGQPLVEIWLGLLLSPVHHYDWEKCGDFYSDAQEILLKQRQR